MPERSHRFARRERVLKRNDFVRIQSLGEKSHSRHFVFVVSARDALPCRLGIVVSTRVDARAVRRNRIKRHLRESFRVVKENFLKPFDLVVIAKHSAGECTLKDVSAELWGALRKQSLVR